MSLLNQLHWRYATKKMNGEKIAEVNIDYILDAAMLAPSAAGLQPFKIIVITNPILKAQIREIARGQQPVEFCSHLLVFASWDAYDKDRIKEMIDLHNQVRSLPYSATEDLRNMLLSDFTAPSIELQQSDTAKQAYISFAFAIAAAAELEIDTSPMGLFDKDALDNLLGLRNLGLQSVLLLGVGYRDNNEDKTIHLKKVRKSKDDLFFYIN